MANIADGKLCRDEEINLCLSPSAFPIIVKDTFTLADMLGKNICNFVMHLKHLRRID